MPTPAIDAHPAGVGIYGSSPGSTGRNTPVIILRSRTLGSQSLYVGWMQLLQDKGPMAEDEIQTVRWLGDAATGILRLIDQTRLPTEFVEIECRDVPSVWEAIRSLRVRGAPAIGVAAAYGSVLGARSAGSDDAESVRVAMLAATGSLRTSRPTAVNLFWALDRMEAVAAAGGTGSAAGGPELLGRLLEEARRIDAEDREMCRAIGRHGAALVGPGEGILTHCNAGGLATADYGTALAVIFAAHERGTSLRVFADETRPLLQGARLTAWELQRRGIPVTLICDSMAAQVMREGKIQMVVVGADRIAANGDTANKIGTYGVALLARAHAIPFYVAAPSSTFDLSIPDGSAIPIEQRDPREVTHGFGRQTAPDGVDVYNPAFDVTPADLIAGLITEKGVIRPVNARTIREVLGAPR
jgi:methylthioribose-1-phosphate isomerase